MYGTHSQIVQKKNVYVCMYVCGKMLKIYESGYRIVPSTIHIYESTIYSYFNNFSVDLKLFEN